MAVQQNKKSPSKRGMHRSHDFLVAPPLAVEPTTGEVHLRHHVSPSASTVARRLPRPRASNSPGREAARHPRGDRAVFIKISYVRAE